MKTETQHLDLHFLLSRTVKRWMTIVGAIPFVGVCGDSLQLLLEPGAMGSAVL